MKRVLSFVLPSLALAAAAAAGSAGDRAAGSDAADRLLRAELLAGLTPVSGPGLSTVLRHSPRKAPPGVDPGTLRLQERDINAVLSALRAAGAEAMAVVGAGGEIERVTLNTAARSGRTGFVINGLEMRAPLKILAIGDAPALKAELMGARGAVRSAGLDVLLMTSC